GAEALQAGRRPDARPERPPLHRAGQRDPARRAEDADGRPRAYPRRTPAPAGAVTVGILTKNLGLLDQQAGDQGQDTTVIDEAGRGLRAGSLALGGQLNAVAGAAAKEVGADEFATGRLRRARELEEEAGAAGPRVRSYKDVHSLRDA